MIEQSGGGDIENAITLAGSAHDYSNLPDIVQFQDHYIQRYVADYPDAFVPVEGADIDWDGFSKEKLSYSIVDGVHYGVPVDNSTVIFAYRTDLLAEVGKTVDDMTGIKWSDLTDIGEQVYAKTGKYLFSTSADGGDLVYMMMQSEGVAEFKDGELGSPGTKRCIVSARPSWIWASARPAIWQTAGATTSTRAFRATWSPVC